MTRITHSMVYARALRDVKASLRDSVKLQGQVATGRRVNRPSDDPAAMLRILPLRAEVRDLTQMADKVGLARETLNLGADALESGSDLLQRLREMLVQANNGTTSDGDLRSLGETAGQLLGQMLGVANTSRAGRYLFGGTATDGAPFELRDDGNQPRVVYLGNDQSVEIEVAPGTYTTLNAPGDNLFSRRSRGPTTFAGGNTGARPSGALDSGVGFGELRVTFAGLGGAPAQITAGTGSTTALGSLSYAVSAGTLSIGGGPNVPIPATNQNFTTADGRVINLTVSATPTPASGSFTAQASLSTDGGASTTIVDFANSAVQVRNSIDGTVLNVDVTNLTRTGNEAVTYEGTFDVFTLLIEARDTLRSAGTAARPDISTKLQRLLAEFEGAHDSILDGINQYGSRSEQMTALTSRVQGLEVAARESLSLAEDADLTESILQMNEQQLTYQASLAVSARIVQTSLLDFLR
jgi:flagellar hook-associated protein 3 FlgL